MPSHSQNHRARRILTAVGRAYPNAWKQVALFRSAKGDADFSDWPDWCFMPISAGYAIVSGGGDRRVPLELGSHPAIVTGLATWRMTQGIYRFDNTVLDAVVDTPLEGGLPTDLLRQLPEWCVYVEMSGDLFDTAVHGFWAWLEFDVSRNGRAELRVMLDLARNPDDPLRPDGPSGFLAVPLALDAPDIKSAWQRLMEPAAAPFADVINTDLLGSSNPFVAGNPVGDIVRRALSLLLYICSASGEISDRSGSDSMPGNPKPQKTRRHGLKEFAANNIREWDVGTRMGAALRAAYARDADESGTGSSGRPVRPHIRRAHWHTFLSGPRKRADGTKIPPAERKRDLRWQPPVAVNLEDVEQLPSTIRRVD